LIPAISSLKIVFDVYREFNFALSYTLLHFIADQMSEEHVLQLRNDSVLYREAGTVDLGFFDAQLKKLNKENSRLGKSYLKSFDIISYKTYK